VGGRGEVGHVYGTSTRAEKRRGKDAFFEISQRRMGGHSRREPDQERYAGNTGVAKRKKDWETTSARKTPGFPTSVRKGGKENEERGKTH